MFDLSILIPARNEEFLQRTIEDILEHIEADTEIIVTLDGKWADPPVEDHDRVTLIYHPESVGQRAATNDAAKLARSKYVMKVDAHCAFAQGFDRIMLEDMRDDWTMVPVMKNLHGFDLVCEKCGTHQYQTKTPTACANKECDNTTAYRKEIVWKGKDSPNSRSYCFDPEPHFQYFRSFSNRPEGKGDITPTMSLQGSCFMLTLEKYWELDVCEERFGSWGSQGIEVAVKTWLSGGQVMVNQKTWYAHLFRTQGGNFGFPYSMTKNKVNRAKKYARELFFQNQWPQQVRPLSWLVEKFWPVEHWTDKDLADLKKFDSALDVGEFIMPSPSMPAVEAEDASSQQPDMQSMPEIEVEEAISVQPEVHAVTVIDEAEPTKGILYYTDNRLDPVIMDACQSQLEKVGLPITSVSLKPLDFGHNIVLDAERGPLTMFKQILAGLEAMDTTVVFFSEHDVLYSHEHFDFTPPEPDKVYYNQNAWRVNAETGEALFYYSSATSGLCAYRDVLLKHYRKRVAMVEANGFTRRMGYEPGTHGRAERVDDLKSDTWLSELPNIDIRHGKNLTRSRWRKEEFRNQRFTKGWTMADEVPGWGQTLGRFSEILSEIANGRGNTAKV